MTTSIRELARKVKRLERAVYRATTPQLAASAIEDGAVEAYEGDSLTMVVGQQYDGTSAAAVVNGPPPPKPSDPEVTPAAGGLIISWDGLWAEGTTTVAPMDFARVDVVVGSDPIATPPKASIQSPRGGEVFIVLPEQSHDVYLVARSLPGKASEPSGPVAATPLPVATGAGGVATFHTDEEPLGLGLSDEGALWTDPGNGNLQHRWDGTDWIAMPISGGGLAHGGVQAENFQFNPLGGVLGNAIPDPRFGDASWNAKRLAQAGPGWALEPTSNLLPSTAAGWTLGPSGTSLSTPAPTTPGTVDLQIDVQAMGPGEVIATSALMPFQAAWDHSFHAGVVSGQEYIDAKIEVLNSVGTVLKTVTHTLFDGGYQAVTDTPNATHARVVIVSTTLYGGPVTLRGLSFIEHDMHVLPPQNLLTFTASATGVHDCTLVENVPVSSGDRVRAMWSSTALAGSPETQLVLTYHFENGASVEQVVIPSSPSAILNHNWMSIWAGPYSAPSGATSVDLSVRVVASAGDKVAFSHAQYSVAGLKTGGMSGVVAPDFVDLGDPAYAAFWMDTHDDTIWMSGRGMDAGFWGNDSGFNILKAGQTLVLSPAGVASSQGLLIQAPTITVSQPVQLNSQANWATVTSLSNGWVARSGDPVQYRKDASGNVHIRGLVDSGTATGTVFTLPTGYRPTQRIMMGARTASGFARLDIETDGTVKILSDLAAAASYCSLAAVFSTL